MTVEVPTRSAAHEAELSPSELSLAIALAGVQPCRESPLMRADGTFLQPAAAPYDDCDVEGLFRKGLLDIAPTPQLTAEWKRALTILADPLWSVRMALGEHGEEHMETQYSRGPLTPDSLVYFRPHQEHEPCVISFPYGPPNILALLEQAGFLATPGSSDDAGEELNYREYIALLTSLDVLRGDYFETLLARGPQDTPTLRIADLEEALRAGTQTNDPRWLVSIGKAISPFDFTVPSDAWPSLMEALGTRGYLSPADDGWAPTHRLVSMRDTLLIAPSYFVIDLTMNLSGNLFEIHNFAAIRGTNALWVFDFFALATAFPRVWANTGPGEELATMFDYLVQDLKAKSEAALQTRTATDSGPRATARPPSPPTLRRLSGPATSSRLRAVPAAASRPAAPLFPLDIDPSDAETILSARRTPTETEQVYSESVALPPVIPFEGLSAQPHDATQEAPCPHCGLPILVGKRFCRHCGEDVLEGGSREPLPIASPPPRRIPSDTAGATESVAVPQPALLPQELAASEAVVEREESAIFEPTVVAEEPVASEPTVAPEEPAVSEPSVVAEATVVSESTIIPRKAAPSEPPSPAEEPPSPAEEPPSPAEETAVVEAPVAPESRDVEHELIPAPVDRLAWLRGDLAQEAPPTPPPASTPPSDPLAWLRGAVPVQPPPPAVVPSVSAPIPPRVEAPAPPPPEFTSPPPPKTPTCGTCGLPVPEAARFCGHCGTNVAAQRERTCPSCNGRLALNARFCAFCGHSVT